MSSNVSVEKLAVESVCSYVVISMDADKTECNDISFGMDESSITEGKRYCTYVIAGTLALLFQKNTIDIL